LDGVIQPAEWNFLFAGLLIIPISLAVLMSTIISPNASAVRRLIGIGIDLSFTTYSLYVLDDLGTPMVSVYLWVTFGNGFRYGARYLGVAAITSVCGFSLVLYASDYWLSIVPLASVCSSASSCCRCMYPPWCAAE